MLPHPIWKPNWGVELGNYTPQDAAELLLLLKRMLSGTVQNRVDDGMPKLVEKLRKDLSMLRSKEYAFLKKSVSDFDDHDFQRYFPNSNH